MTGGKRLIIVMGTGRCGTRSMWKVLNSQPSVSISHEFPPALPWKRDSAALARKLKEISARPGPLVGDVAFYYLPYAEEVLASHPEARIVCLRRDRAETVSSFARWCAGAHRWLEHSGGKYKRDGWDKCYPKYDIQDPDEACGRYWDEYYAAVATPEKRFPGRVRLWDMEEALNNEDTQSTILRFVGIPEEEQVPQIGVREHRS